MGGMTKNFAAAIRALRSEAAEHGDHDQVTICDVALGNAPVADSRYEHAAAPFRSRAAARQACLDVMQAAKAQREVGQ